MNKIKLSKINKSKKYKLVINGAECCLKLNNMEDSGGVIKFLKDYYNFADMITEEKVKNEEEFLEYLQSRKSPGCDKIELFEI